MVSRDTRGKYDAQKKLLQKSTEKHRCFCFAIFETKRKIVLGKWCRYYDSSRHANRAVQTLSAHWMLDTKHMNRCDQNKLTRSLARSPQYIEEANESKAECVRVCARMSQSRIYRFIDLCTSLPSIPNTTIHSCAVYYFYIACPTTDEHKHVYGTHSLLCRLHIITWMRLIATAHKQHTPAGVFFSSFGSHVCWCPWSFVFICIQTAHSICSFE